MTTASIGDRRPRGLGFFERYLTIWVAMSIVAGIGLGKIAPGIAKSLDAIAIYSSGAALATVVGVLIEVPVMLMLVRICLKTKDWFPPPARLEHAERI